MGRKAAERNGEVSDSDVPLYCAVFIIFSIILIAICGVDPLRLLQERAVVFHGPSWRWSQVGNGVEVASGKTSTEAVKKALEQQLRGVNKLKDKLQREKSERAEKKEAQVSAVSRKTEVVDKADRRAKAEKEGYEKETIRQAEALNMEL